MPAYYSSSLAEFIKDDPDRVVEILTTQSTNTGFVNLKQRQIKPWQAQVSDLMTACEIFIRERAEASHWAILLEYPIPRRQKRIDAVLLARDLIFCVEFKTKAKTHSLQAQKQAEDYALDLRDFHSGSHGRRI